MGWIGVILLGILIWAVGTPERRYRKEQYRIYKLYTAGLITFEQYSEMDTALLFRRHKL